MMKKLKPGTVWRAGQCLFNTANEFFNLKNSLESIDIIISDQPGKIEEMGNKVTEISDKLKKECGKVVDVNAIDSITQTFLKQYDESLKSGNYANTYNAFVDFSKLVEDSIEEVKNSDYFKKLKEKRKNVMAKTKAEPTPQAGAARPAPPKDAPKKRSAPPKKESTLANSQRAAQARTNRPAPPKDAPKKGFAPLKNESYVSVFNSSFKQIDLSKIKNADEFQKLYTKFNDLRGLCPEWYKFIEDTFNDNVVKKALNKNTAMGIFLASCGAADDTPKSLGSAQNVDKLAVSKAAHDAMKCVIDKLGDTGAQFVWNGIKTSFRNTNTKTKGPSNLKAYLKIVLGSKLDINGEVVTAIIGHIK